MFAMLAATYGIHLPMAMDFLPDQDDPNYGIRYNHPLAMDAQPTTVTGANAGIPAFLTTVIDPEIVRVLVQPMKAADIMGGEIKKGDWTAQTEMFPVVESTGEVSSYGDYNNNGSVGANVNWPSRQSYLFQTITQYGDLALDRAGEAKIDLVSNLNIASALVMAKFQNKSYFYGIAGLQNYGLLNDPSLTAPITPASVNSSVLWSNKDGQGVYNDILSLFQQLVSQSGGLIEMDEKMTLAMSPTLSVNLGKTNQYNINVKALLKENFPNLTVKTAPEYSTTGGELVQLIVDEYEGVKTAQPAFNEKMRAHTIVRHSSSYEQKKTGGTWGTIIKRPFLIAQMLGC